MAAIGKNTNVESGLDAAEVREVVAGACQNLDLHNRRVLLIIPDATRTAPVGALFKAIHAELGETASALDILVALGTHQAMSEEAICQRLEISMEERKGRYGRVRFFNHAWDKPAALRVIGTIPSEQIHQLSEGRFAMDVPVQVNKLLYDYDQLVIVGPVFPHEVVGFSGGNKYLFPGVAGPDVLNFFHWLGAVISTPKIIGNKWTAVRRVIDFAGSMVTVPKLCFCMVVGAKGMSGLYAGTPEEAWSEAADLSARLHVTLKPRPFHTILACSPTMYDEIWTGGKCMYKLEPVLADGGELIIYAPHIREVSFTHGHVIEQVGYHCRDYFLKQWDRFKHFPWGVLAHSIHVYGLGTFENGVEVPRARVTLATGISEEKCRQINLGYRDPATIRPEDYDRREHEGVFMVPKAGERLFRLEHPPAWATV